MPLSRPLPPPPSASLPLPHVVHQASEGTAPILAYTPDDDDPSHFDDPPPPYSSMSEDHQLIVAAQDHGIGRSDEVRYMMSRSSRYLASSRSVRQPSSSPAPSIVLAINDVDQYGTWSTSSSLSYPPRTPSSEHLFVPPTSAVDADSERALWRLTVYIGIPLLTSLFVGLIVYVLVLVTTAAYPEVA